jgi:hypothetical protein
MPVVMGDVLAQGGEEMSFAVNEALVQTLPARGAYPAFRDAFARGARAGVRTIRTPSAAKTASNDPTNFVSRSRIRDVNWAVRSPRSITRCGRAGSPTPRSDGVLHTVNAPYGWRSP